MNDNVHPIFRPILGDITRTDDPNTAIPPDWKAVAEQNANACSAQARVLNQIRERLGIGPDVSREGLADAVMRKVERVGAVSARAGLMHKQLWSVDLTGSVACVIRNGLIDTDDIEIARAAVAAVAKEGAR